MIFPHFLLFFLSGLMYWQLLISN